MRIARVARKGGPEYGVVRDGHVVLVEGHPFTEFRLTDQVAPLDKVRLLAPVIPSKILCVGKNYADHAAEMRGDVPAEPLIFSKPATAVVGPGEPIRLPALSQEVHHEAELAVVVGVLSRKVSPEDALGRVLGFTCANDVTARDLQARDGQWTRAKGFDSFCPLGPWIDTDVDPADGLGVRCRVNGDTRQDGSTADLVFGVAELVAYCSAFATLLPGDVILTGTPAGVGPLVDGDVVEVEIDGLGTLSNPVSADE
ncbi:MAG TPA: fumarylacetoacetate hydrolase family protein [Egibacteraceae bacterium]|nr:fumarylacetoacetate hydrolase family protein [Egibacteraceae bacterium]